MIYLGTFYLSLPIQFTHEGVIVYEYDSDS